MEEVEETLKQCVFELGKIRKDLFLFLKYVKIQEPGDLAVEYQLWPHLIDFYNNLLNEQLIDLIKAKQIGISWALAIYATWKIMCIPGFNVLEISRGGNEAQKLLAKSKIVWNNLPEWIKKQPCFVIGDNSTEKFGFRDLKSGITAFTSTEVAGIGETAGLVIHDESDFHDFYEVNLSHTSATVADSTDRRLVSVSTVDKTRPDSYFKRHWKDARDRKNGFKALFYGYDVRPNRDQSFYDAMMRANESTPWVVEANYPRTVEEALSPQSALSCFKKEALDSLWDNSVEPLEIRQGFIHIFSKPRVGVTYVAGADVGEGVGLDYSCLTILGKHGLGAEVVAIIYTNNLATDHFAYECDKVCREYFNCLLAVENNGLGVAVINKLEELNYTNLFSSEAQKKRDNHKEVSGTEKNGWTTGDKNKYTSTVELVNTIDDGSLITEFGPQIKEMMEYQWVIAGGKNKPTATGSTHGDTVISLGIVNQMLKYVGITVKPSMWLNGRQLF